MFTDVESWPYSPDRSGDITFQAHKFLKEQRISEGGILGPVSFILIHAYLVSDGLAASTLVHTIPCLHVAGKSESEIGFISMHSFLLVLD